MHKSISSYVTAQNVAFVVALCTLSAFAWLSLQTATRLVEDRAAVENAHAILDHLGILSTRVERAEGTRRGFAAMGDIRYLAPYENTRREITETLSTLQTLVRDPAQKGKLAEITLKTHDLLKAIDDGIELRKSKEFSSTEQRAAADQIRSMIEQSRFISQSMQALEQGMLRGFREESEARVAKFRYILLLTTIGTFLLLIYSFAKYSSELQRRQRTEEGLVESQRQAELAVHRLTLLGEMSKLLQSCTHQSDVYRLVSQYAVRLIDSPGALYLMLDTRKHLEAKASWGNPAGSEETFQRDDCLALRHGEPHLSADGATLACRHIRARPGTSSQCLPIIAHGEVLGTLYVEANPTKTPQIADQRLAVNFANQIGLAIANMNLRDRLQGLSVRDPLTELFNRRYMEESLAREVATASRKKRTLALAMLDLDHFKSFNDTFGHDAGDLLLQEVAKLLQRFVRGSDVACRYGGEEFVLIFPETSLSTMTDRINLLRAEIRALRLHHFNRPLGQVTASIGVAVYPAHGNSPEELLRAADCALYVAKENGRDRIELAASAKS